MLVLMSWMILAWRLFVHHVHEVDHGDRSQRSKVRGHRHGPVGRLLPFVGLVVHALTRPPTYRVKSMKSRLQMFMIHNNMVGAAWHKFMYAQRLPQWRPCRFSCPASLAQLLLPNSSCPAPLAQQLFPISACPQADDPDEDKYLDPCAYFMGMYNDAAKRDSLATEFRAVIQMMAPHGGVGPIQTVAPSTDSNA